MALYKKDVINLIVDESWQDFVPKAKSPGHPIPPIMTVLATDRAPSMGQLLYMSAVLGTNLHGNHFHGDPSISGHSVLGKQMAAKYAGK